MADRSAEDVVRDYLRYLADPSSVTADTADIDRRIEAADDPIERLKLRSERSKLEDVGASLEAAFVQRAKGFVDEAGIDADALLAEGVERRVLVEAGIVSGSRRRGSGKRSSSSSSSSGRTRVTREEVETYVRNLRKGTSFTTQTVVNDAGASVATVRKVIDGLIEEGAVTEDGKDHSGPGRPRTLYTRA